MQRSPRPAPGEDRQVHADVVAAVREGDGSDLQDLRAVRLLHALSVVPAVPVGFPCLPGVSEGTLAVRAAELGPGAGKAAATWAFDANSPDEAYWRVLRHR